MVHAVILDVHASVEVYDAVHAQLLQDDVTSIEGLMLHLDRSSPEGPSLPLPDATVIDVCGLVVPPAPVAF